MTASDVFTIEPWGLRESALELEHLARTESLFALSNGHVGVRGNLEEGEPSGLPGTYLNGVYERRPLPYAEAGYGFPEDGQTAINVTDGKIMRLLVDDEPFDVRYGELHAHERRIDFREGVLQREVEWTSPAGQQVLIRSWRLVSLTQRSVVALCLEVEVVGEEARVVVQSELVADEDLPVRGGDPRVAAALKEPLVHETGHAKGTGATLVHQTRASQLRIAAAMDHETECPQDVNIGTELNDNWARITFSTKLRAGETLRVVKYVTYGWSQQRTVPALRDQVAAAMAAARDSGWQGLVDEQRDYLRWFWERSDVEVDGDAELQQAVRFAMFHVLQAGARAEGRSIPAKGLTGPGYDGHCFWDTETFVLPVLTHTVPKAAADVLRWRHSTLPIARERAHQLGLEGAAFPWRTINGAECSAYWPAGTAAFHVNADIADALVRHLQATGDETLERDIGVELLIETARLWRSLGHHDRSGAFHIVGVTGPDEYSAIADDNVFTNLMARRNLRAAAEMVARHPRLAGSFDADHEEAAAWRDAAEAIVIPWDDELGVHPQSAAFTVYERWDFAATPDEAHPLFLHYPYFDLYRKQVVKQADLVLAIQRCGDAFTPEEKRRDFDYYEAITVRDSSLSACSQAVVAAEVGHLGLAYDYACEAAFMDLHDLGGNTADGLHMASLAGAWVALVEGLGGMRDEQRLKFTPQLPDGLDRLAFGLVRGDALLRVEVFPDRTRYQLVAGDHPVDLCHHGQDVRLSPGETVECSQERPPVVERPSQPPGREPIGRHSVTRRLS
ncbi:MAG: putative glycosyl transferase [Nocardioidaceae bacterium]|nr:putative glycosyl transferase [Nocardioidaceae bacterium]